MPTTTDTVLAHLERLLADASHDHLMARGSRQTAKANYAEGQRNAYRTAITLLRRSN